jgi:thiol-disulfide isomerase/thioredoxin
VAPIIEDAQLVQEDLTIEEIKPFKDFTPFWNYYANKIKLNEDFISYDKNKNRILKSEFLKKLATGIYQPILINPTDSIRYQLKPSPDAADDDISLYMKQFAHEQLVFYQMEGHLLPKFNFTTIDNVNNTSENTKGKILLIKCWFISCKPCIQEMPELNKLVEKYKNETDIIFLSLAIDNKMQLKDFLKKTQFDYQTVANQDNYMSEKLNVVGYPTHLLVNKEGQVVKISNDAQQIKGFLEKMLKEI